MYLTPRPLVTVREGGAAPSDPGLDWMLAAPSVCVIKGCVTELVGTFLGAAEGSEDRSKARNTLQHVACVPSASAATGGGRRDHAGTQEFLFSGCHVLSILSLKTALPSVQLAFYYGIINIMHKTVKPF